MDKKTRVLFVIPPLRGDLRAGIRNVKFPLGPAYIAAYLEKNGFFVRIIDSLAYYEKVKKLGPNKYHVGLSYDEIEKRMREINADVIGINCGYTAYEQDAFEIANLAKKINPNSLIVFGGAHSSAEPNSVFKNKNVDLIAFGEGEETFNEIISKYENKEKLTGIDGTIERGNTSPIKNKPRPFIKDLDSLPFPARHLLPMERYITHPDSALWAMRGRSTDIITSRGCPQHCSFCSIFTVWGRVWRSRSPTNVVDEIEHVVKTYNVKQFRIQDDNLAVSGQRIKEICKELIKRKLDIKWYTPNGIAIWTLNEEILTLMKKAGYYLAIFGIESGNEETLKYIDKPINLKYARKIIGICHRLGIWTCSTFLLGFPHESMKHIRDTIEFAKDSGLDFAQFYIAQPYAGTPLYKKFQEEGLLDEGIKESSSLAASQYRTHYFSGDELQGLQQQAYAEFMKHKMKSLTSPRFIIKTVLPKNKSFEEIMYSAKIVKNLVNQKVSSVFIKDEDDLA